MIRARPGDSSGAMAVVERSSEWRGRVGLALGSLALTLAVVEVGLRLTLSAGERMALPRVGFESGADARLHWLERVRTEGRSGWYGFDAPDADLGWSVRPGVSIRSTKSGSYDVVITTTADGLRGGTDPAPQKPRHGPRVAIFGCSQTFGEGVSDTDTYAARLAEEVPQAVVLNFGVHGYGTDQMLLRYERDGLRHAPDVVVLAFAGFHLARNVSGFTFFAKPRFEVDADGLLHLVGVPVPTPEHLATQGLPRETFADDSVLLRWLWQRERNLDERRLYRPNSDAWYLTRALITRFAHDVGDAGGTFILMNIDERSPGLDTALRELAAALKVGFLDLAPKFRALAARGVQYRLNGDLHWNATGHDTVARELGRFLCREGLVGGCLKGEP